jgi:hypothetical protein
MGGETHAYVFQMRHQRGRENLEDMGMEERIMHLK